MKVFYNSLSYGLQKFIKGKHLDLKDISTYLQETYPNKIVVKQGVIINADDLIDSNWKHFADWVNVNLNKGLIKGKNRKLSNGSSEAQAEYNKKCKQFIDQAEAGTYELYNYVRNNCKHCKLGNLFQEFFDTQEIVRKYRAGDAPEFNFGFGKRFKFHWYYMDFKQIVDDQLEEQFKFYIYESSK